MFEKLDSVDWKSVDEVEMPKWINDLASNQLDIRNKAYDKIAVRIAPWELSSGYGTTQQFISVFEKNLPFLVLPFLFEILKLPNYKFQYSILELIFDLSMISNLKFMSEEVSQILPKHLHENANQTHKLIISNIHVFDELPQTEDLQEIRHKILDLLKLNTDN